MYRIKQTTMRHRIGLRALGFSMLAFFACSIVLELRWHLALLRNCACTVSTMNASARRSARPVIHDQTRGQSRETRAGRPDDGSPRTRHYACLQMDHFIQQQINARAFVLLRRVVEASTIPMKFTGL